MKYVIIITIIVGLIILLMSCFKNFKLKNDFSLFKIKKGKHRSTFKIKYICNDTLNFDVILTESCKYKSKLEENQYDVNKIFGMSDGGNHMKNSARLGWRYLNGNLELMSFIHNNGVFSFQKICDAEINTIYNCKIRLLYDKYEFTINNHTILMDRFKNNTNCKYLLYPYFGGNETAPHNIEIKIKLNQ